MRDTRIKKNTFLAIVGVTIISVCVPSFAREVLQEKEMSPREAVRSIPQEAELAVYISTDEKDWSHLKQFGTPDTQKFLEESSKSFVSGLAEDGVDYETDLKPWLGNFTIALVPSENEEAGKILIVAGVKNDSAAMKFFNKIKNERKTSFKESKYEGITITKTLQQDKEPSYIAFIDDRLIIAEDIEIVKSAIDTSKGGSSLATKLASKDALNEDLDMENTLCQVYLPDFSSLVKQASAASEQNPIPENVAERLRVIQGISLGIGTNQNGIHLRGLARITPDPNLLEYKPVPGESILRFPPNTVALISGGGLSRTWSWLGKEAEKDSRWRTVLTQWRNEARKGANLNLDRDIFGWMDGEFAFGIVPSTKGVLADMGLGGLLTWTTSDRPTAEKTIAKLENLMKSDSSISFLRKNNVTEWRNARQQTMFAYGWHDDRSLLMTLGTPLDEIIDIQPRDSLSESDIFNKIAGSLPKDNAGYFYLNFERVMAKITEWSQNAEQPIPLEIKSFLDSIAGISLAGRMPDTTTTQVDILFSLKSSNRE